jgi:polyphenol oxidase
VSSTIAVPVGGFQDELYLQAFLSYFTSGCLILPRQTHSKKWLELRCNEELAQFIYAPYVWYAREESDAVLFHRTKPLIDAINQVALRPQVGVVIGVKTADCLPLLLQCGDFYSVVHAGWRGLACGIVEYVIQRVVSLTPQETPIRVYIGPHISMKRYEVGLEVISSFTRISPHYEEVNERKVLLDLGRTAKRIVESLLTSTKRTFKIELSRECTWDSSHLHSFRRDGEKSGRNLTFFRIPG